MAQQIAVHVYGLNNVNLNKAGAQTKDVPAAIVEMTDIRSEQRAIDGIQVYSELRWTAGGVPQKAYCSDLVSDLLTAANA